MAKDDKKSTETINQHAPAGFVMFVGFVGALLYFLRSANDFGDVLLAFVKAIVWPGIVVYHVLLSLGA